jgi:sRNA-binding regulator protein Hfq
MLYIIIISVVPITSNLKQPGLYECRYRYLVGLEIDASRTMQNLIRLLLIIASRVREIKKRDSGGSGSRHGNKRSKLKDSGQRNKGNSREARPTIHPKLRGKEVIIRLISGGQPITGTIEGYNPQEILIQTAKGQLLVFKHAIATIEIMDEP